MMVLAVNEDQVTPGLTAFLVVAALGVTLFFLIRSMNRQIARIEAPSDEDQRQAEWERSQGAASTSSATSAAAPGTAEKAKAVAEDDQGEA